MLALLASCAMMTTHSEIDPEEHRKWAPVWSDEFDGPAGAAPDAHRWKNDVGPKWYNNELEEYTAGNKNAFLDGKGHLIIEARNEGTSAAPHYTSARLKTEGIFAQAYGKFEARIKLPAGKGIWPAFWMLGDDIGRAGWPGCGELDILEIKGSHPAVLMGTAHGPGYSGGNGKGGKITNPGGSLADDYHVYTLEWEPNRIRWFLDGTCYHTLVPSDLDGKKWVYDHPFFIILNLAVGGNFDGNPDESTVFPSRMLVDYVRVYKAG